MTFRLLALALALLSATTLSARAGEEENKLAENSVRVLKKS